MSIRVTCAKCGVVLKVKEDLAGTKGKCPACKGTLYVPTLEEAAAQSAAAPIGATETAAATAAGDTGALKIPATKTKAAKAASAPEAGSPPPPGVNGAALPHAAAPEAAPVDPKANGDPAPAAAESSTDDLDEPEAAAPKPKKPGKARLTMDDSDANAPSAARPLDQPKRTEAAKPAAEATTPPSPPAAKDAPAAKAPKGDGDEFDLDSFLMEGPKPKAPPPVPEESPGKKGSPPPRAGSGRRLSMSDDETNVSGPSETLPPPNRRGSAADSAMAALTGGTSSSAKDLLAKASQEGRARASSMPEDQRERFDFGGAIKTIGKDYGLQVVGTIALCAVLYFGMDYMMGSGHDLPQLARVHGRVTVKKQPVEGVVVTFTPVGAKDSKDAGTKLKKGKPRDATGITDKDGRYELMYEEGIRGAVVGQNRVWIDPFTLDNMKKIPGHYQQAATSGDTREVKATGGEENIDL